MDQEDELVDFNEYDESGNIVEAPQVTAQGSSRSPITSPMSLKDDQENTWAKAKKKRVKPTLN
jgi:hypothetical protein